MKVILFALGFSAGVLGTQAYFLREMDPRTVTKGLLNTAENSHRTGCLTATRRIKGDLPEQDGHACRREARSFAEGLARSLGE